MGNKGILYDNLPGIIIGIGILVFVIVSMISDTNYNYICHQNNYSMQYGALNTKYDLENGYVMCCNKAYVNHLRVNDTCKIFRWDEK